MSMAEKYPLTEKLVELRKPTYKRWQYTLSGWLFLIRTQPTEEGKAMESQICARMFEDQEFNDKIRKEFEDWLAEEPEEELDQDWRMEEVEDDLRRNKRKSTHYGGKYKGRGKERNREP